jgi:hypothetical protein
MGVRAQALWIAAIGLALVLLAPAAALAAAPAPKAAAPTPSIPLGPPPISCQTANLAQLTTQLSSLARESVVPATDVTPDSAESVFTYLHPNATGGHLEFVAFLAEPKDNQYDPTQASTPLTVLRIDHPPVASQNASLSATDAQNAYALHLQAPALSSPSPRQHRVLVVFACRTGDSGAVDQPVGYAVRPLVMSTAEGASFIAGAGVAIVYLLAGTLVWAKRKSDASAANELEATPPTRVTKITPWRWTKCLDPVAMSSDMFDRASLSKLQILFFILVVSFGVTYTLIRTGSLSDLSSSIVLLLGIPAFGALGTQAAAVTRDRISLDNWAWLANRGVFPLNDPGRDQPRWRDLVMSDAELDLYKLQALIFSLIVGGALISSGFSNLATFKVPDTLLQVLGLSQVVFVGGRLTKPTTIGDLDDLVTDMRARAAAVRAAASSNIDVDANGKPLRAATAADARARRTEPTLAAAKKSVPNAVARYEEVADEVEILLKQMTHRDVELDQLRDPMQV